MNDFLEGVVNAIVSDFGSKLNGRRNYSIVTCDKTFWANGYGVMEKHNMFSWQLSFMGEHNMKIWHYTYKKDFEEAKEQLKKQGYFERRLY